MRIVKLTETEKAGILENLLKRSPNQYGKFEATVNEILENVKIVGNTKFTKEELDAIEEACR